MKTMLVKDFMTQLPHTVGEALPIAKAEEMMAKHKCHHLPVLEGGHLVGVISAHDVGMIQGLEKGDSLKVSDLMTEEPLVVDPEKSVKDVAKEMLKLKVGSAIVRAKDGKPWGIFTVTDALKVIAEHL